MATKKATTTKKTTAAKSTKAAPKKTAPKKTATVKTTKAAPKKSQRISVDTNTSVGVRVFIVALGILAAIAFQLTIGKYNGEAVTGAKILELGLDPETASGMFKEIMAIIAPVGLFEISTILLIVRSDKFMSFMAVMIDAIALVLLLVFQSVFSPVAIGWLLVLFSIVVGIIFEITSYIISKK